MMNMPMRLLLAAVLVLLLAGCDNQKATVQKQREEADSLMNAAYLKKDYQRLITLADSLKQTGGLTDVKACYWLGYANDRMMQKRMAEFYWKTGIAAVEKSEDPEDLKVYGSIASRLTGLRCTWGEYEAALKIAVPAVERLQEMGCDTTSDYTNLLIYVGCCQSRFGIGEIKTNENLEKGFRAHLNNIRRHPSGEAYRDAFVGIINICYNYIEIAEYEQAGIWVDRFDSLLTSYEQVPDARPDYIDKQRARYFIYRASALEGLGRKEEAAEAYRSFQQTAFGQSAEGRILGGDYLSLAELWQEAADNYGSVDAAMEQYGSKYSLEHIQKMMLKKYRINVKAERMDSVQDVCRDIVEHLDSAITTARLTEAREQEAVHQKELEMTAEREEAQRQRQIGRLIMMGVAIFALIVYIVVRQRMQRRLKKAHDDLKVAYDQLEETTTAKERMESELRIARDIQMSMVNHELPQREGVDMYAAMTPAKEVGGDLYGYLLKADSLYFCIGDASGKGVPASLFMAQASRLFRTLASQDMKPDEIATRMNAELADDNEQGMFVTMIIGLLDLTTGRLDFCNAGHNPPVIGKADGHFAFLDVIPNAPIGLWPELVYEGQTIDNFHETMLLLYTDGLNEAENQQQQQYGEERILEILSELTSSSAHDVVEALRDDANRFRDGAEPNDDLTMLAIKYTK